MLKLLSRVHIKFNALDLCMASCMEFLAQCNTRKAKESNPAYLLDVQWRTDEQPPQITVNVVDSTATLAQVIRKKILERGHMFETKQMFHEASKCWQVVIPKDEFQMSFSGTKVHKNSSLYQYSIAASKCSRLVDIVIMA